MHLKILIPFGIFADEPGVLRVVAETRDGSFGILPNRLDCVAGIAPGILAYETKENAAVYVAVDEGVLVKAGQDVLVSVRQAVGGTDLSQLHEAVKRRFLTVDQQERTVRGAVAKMQSGFLSRFAEFQHGR
jgi:F-type H+-transporting ATPase subunit epsilon